MLKKNSFLLGLLFGVAIPALLSLAFLGIDWLVKATWGASSHFSLKNILFVSIALNIVPIRYFLMKEDLSRTGKGILLVTVISIVLVTVFVR
jgi:hypothetical protein